MVVPTPATDCSSELNLDNLRALRVLGRGAMGTVFLVHDSSADPSSSSSTFALKVLDKSSALSKHDANRRARWEISVLSGLSRPDTNHHHHPFLPQLIGSFETEELLGWAIPYCPGGDLNALRYHQVDRVFSPAVIKFYAAEIICALEHLHSSGIAYRDLKPENVLIQQSGHVTLTDFDLSRQFNQKKAISIPLQAQNPIFEADPQSKKHRKSLTRRFISATGDAKVLNLKKAKSARVSPVSRRRPSFSDGERSNSFVGTEEYIAPEIVRGDGHEFAVDWWALGVLAYEMLYGTTPFKGKNRKETFRNVLMKPPEFIGKRTPLMDLIGRLLEKDPTRRLGYLRGASEIKEHPFFSGIKWDLLTEVVRPPFIPSRDDDGVERSTAGGFDIREYFHRQRQPPPLPPQSPLPSPSNGSQRSLSLTEF